MAIVKKVREKALPLSLKNKLSFVSRISDRKKYQFYYMLRFYLQSGLPILEGLELVFVDTRIGSIPELSYDIRNGRCFAQSLKNAGLTDEFIYSCLQIGENTGNYPKVFSDIILYLDQKLNDKKYFVRVISYPVLLFIMILLILGFVIFTVTPQLYKTLSGIRVQIPPSLSVMYQVNRFLIRYRKEGIFLSIVFVCVLFSGIWNQRIASSAKNFLYRRKVIRSFYQTYALRSIFWQISILFSSGVNLISSIRIVAEGIEYAGYREVLLRIANGIASGESFYTMLREQELYFSTAIISYIKLGESTDSMQENLENIVALLDIKTQDMAENTKKLLQPTLVILAGLMVSALLALVLPIINSATSVRGL